MLPRHRRAIAFGAIALLIGAAPATLRAASAPAVTIASGQVSGVVAGGVASYLGIPYAAPPVGTLRFQPPAPPAALSGVLSATSYGPACPQSSRGTPPRTAEDCLSVNVQTPATAKSASKLPVLVWIHGGGLTSGSSAEYDGSAIVRAGNVVFVSFNYRLGLLGYLAHAALGAEQSDGASGNYGLQDQLAALAWVRANIAGFGGDPNRMTIFGESAGGQSVMDLLVSPKTPKLAGAIIQSGTYAASIPTRAAAEAQGASLATQLGCSGSAAQIATCLRAAPISSLLTLADSLTGNTPISPNVDTRTLLKQPFQSIAAGEFQRVPLVNGSNKDEYRLFVASDDLLGVGPLTAESYDAKLRASAGPLYAQVAAQYPLSAYASPNLAYTALATDFAFSCSARVFNRLARQYTPVYAYEFTEPAPPPVLLPPDPNFPVLGAAHASELVFLFPSFHNSALGLAPANFTSRQAALSAQMIAGWIAHARYGRPLLRGGTAWFGYSTGLDNVVSLTSTGSHTDYTLSSRHQCSFWTPLIAALSGVPGSAIP